MTYLRLLLIIAMISPLLPGLTWKAPQSGLTYQQAEAQLYKPPLRGAPKSRVGGGTRSWGNELPSLSALVPNHMGLTMSNQPELYWFLSKDSSHAVAITLNDEESIESLLKVVINPPLKAGIHRIQLAKHNIRLKPGVPYEWGVTLVTGSDDPSRKVVAGGAIQHIGALDRRKRQVNIDLKNATNQADNWRIYASNGVWYDALAALSAQIYQAPQNATLLQQRATLFSEVNLSEVPADAKQFP